MAAFLWQPCYCHAEHGRTSTKLFALATAPSLWWKTFIFVLCTIVLLCGLSFSWRNIFVISLFFACDFGVHGSKRWSVEGCGPLVSKFHYRACIRASALYKISCSFPADIQLFCPLRIHPNFFSHRRAAYRRSLRNFQPVRLPPMLVVLLGPELFFQWRSCCWVPWRQFWRCVRSSWWLSMDPPFSGASFFGLSSNIDSVVVLF